MGCSALRGEGVCLCADAEIRFCPQIHSEDISYPINFTTLCVLLQAGAVSFFLVLFASSHVWSHFCVAMFVTGVRSFCLFLPPAISTISLMSPLSLTLSTFCVCVCVCDMWQPILACGSRVDLPARTACTVCCHIDVAFFFLCANRS